MLSVSNFLDVSSKFYTANMFDIVGLKSILCIICSIFYDVWNLELLFKMWASGVKVHNCNCLSNVYDKHQSSSMVHPASYSLDSRDSFPEGKVTGAWDWSLSSI